MAGGLGRLPAPDERDRSFLMAASVPPAQVTRDYRYWFANGFWGNQGSHPHCVGHAWVHFLEDGPLTQGPAPPPIVLPTWLYAEAQLVDEWDGQDYSGTSVRAGAKVLQARGFIGEYRWAWDLATVVDALLLVGPVVVGTHWYEGMDDPVSGIVHVSGSIRGGHAYLLNGVNRIKGTIRIKNSWSRAWGVNGHATISFEDFERLIQDEGEACLAVERRPDA